MKNVFLLSVRLLLVGAGACNLCAATILYNMSIVPDAAPLPWSVSGSTALRSVTNGILRINDDGFDFLQYRFTLNGSHRTLEAGIKIDHSYPNGSFGCAYLGFLEPYPFNGIYVYLETNRLCLSACGPVQCTNLDLANRFHVIRLAQDTNGTRLFVDGSQLFSSSQCQYYPDVSFGAASVPAQGGSSWDYVAFTDAGAFGPEEFSFVAPQLTIMPHESGVDLSWNSFIHLTYQVESCSNLTTFQWMPLGDPIAGNGSTNSVVKLVPLGPTSQFYRLIAQPVF